jgi:hypothetical protein
MKTIIILWILISSALMLLFGCRTGPRPDRIGQRAAPARPFYRSNAEGRYYYPSGEQTNRDYQSTVTRNRPMRRRY